MSKFNIFKRKVEKLENSLDLENMIVELPLSKKEVTLANALSEYDKFLNMHGYANGDHMVKVGDSEMSVNDLVKKHLEACNSKGDEGGEPGKGEDEVGELEVAKNDDEATGESDVPPMENEDLIEEVGRFDGPEKRDGGDKSLDSEFSKTNPKVTKGDAVRKSLSNEQKVAKAKADARAKAAALKNANLNMQNQMEAVRVDLAEDQVARGKSRYGSN